MITNYDKKNLVSPVRFKNDVEGNIRIVSDVVTGHFHESCRVRLKNTTEQALSD